MQRLLTPRARKRTVLIKKYLRFWEKLRASLALPTNYGRKLGHGQWRIFRKSTIGLVLVLTTGFLSLRSLKLVSRLSMTFWRRGYSRRTMVLLALILKRRNSGSSFSGNVMVIPFMLQRTWLWLALSSTTTTSTTLSTWWPLSRTFILSRYSEH